MNFYSEIAKYYDEIFPVSKETVEFISRTAGDPPKSMIDICCGKGGYAFELEKMGYDVTAVDLDKKMIEELKTKRKEIGSKVKFVQADMLELNIKFDRNAFKHAFCIGNSLVHLERASLIRNFFYKVKSILQSDSSLIVQIINFDRILSQNIKSLPTIENEAAGLRFERFYRYDGKKNLIYFKSILTETKKKYKNEIPLYPLLYEEAKKMLMDTGFKKIEFYGDFNGADFDIDNSLMMIIHAK